MGNRPEKIGRQQDGRFREGVSGNPAGRPLGARNRSTRLAEAMLDDEAGALTRQAIDLAKAGDVTALRLCIDRLVPKRTERPIEFKIPRISEPKDAVAALSRIMDGVAAGPVSLARISQMPFRRAGDAASPTSSEVDAGGTIPANSSVWKHFATIVRGSQTG